MQSIFLIRPRVILASLTGFFLAVSTAPAELVVDVLPIRNMGNPPDSTTGYGAVSYDYYICKYEITFGDYEVFLNAVAGVDTYHLFLWSPNGVIYSRTGAGTVANPYRYTVSEGYRHRPVYSVEWDTAARFANWMHNGQPTGPQDLTTTEDGAYFLNGTMDSDELEEIERESDWKWGIPSENEWYKAAYHKNDGATANYFHYATSSSAGPGRDLADPSGNNANYSLDPKFPSQIEPPYWVTKVGEFQNSDSPYGTFDQSGNVWEWTDGHRNPTDPSRILRGGAQSSYQGRLSRLWRVYHPLDLDDTSRGFRLVARPADCCRGDFDADSLVSASDVPGFADVMISGPETMQQACTADINQDGLRDGRDIDDFIAIVMSGGACP